MDYETFTRTAAKRAALPRDTVERVEQATLRTLAGRISGGEAQDLASRLPSRSQADLCPARDEGEAFVVEELVRRVAQWPRSRAGRPGPTWSGCCRSARRGGNEHAYLEALRTGEGKDHEPPIEGETA